MRGGSLCTGGGGLDLGLTLALDVEWAWHCEPDPDCSQVLDHHYPGVPNHGDLSSCEWDSVERVDLVAAGFPCFVAGTLILTKDGYRRIENVRVGDLVLTHEGRWRPVSKAHANREAPVRRIRAQGVDVTCTDEHPFLTRRVTYEPFPTGRVVADEQDWTNAEDLDPKGHFIAQVLPPETDEDDHDESFWRLAGRYLADGWLVDRKGRKNGRVVICCARGEEDDLQRTIKDAGYHSTRSRERTVTKFHITRGDLYEFLAPSFGRLAHGKTIPGFALELPKEKAEALLSGYLDGDGYHDSKNHCYRATTVSPSLAYGLALLAQRARGVIATISSTRRPDVKEWEGGRTSRQRRCYSISVPYGNRWPVSDDGLRAWKKIKSNEPLSDRATVYNIAVEEDESYVANGAVVHNCPDYSTAGKRAGIGGGTVRSGSASLLPFARFVPATSSSRMSLESGQRPAYASTQENLLSEWSSPTWPRSAIGGPTTACELPTWARLTSGIDGSASLALLPTPSASESTPTDEYLVDVRSRLDPEDPLHRLYLPGRRSFTQRTLLRMVPALLPTPSASDDTGPELETRERRRLTGSTGGQLRDLPLLLQRERAASADAGRLAGAEAGELDGGPGEGGVEEARWEAREAEHDAAGRSGGGGDREDGSAGELGKLLPTPTGQDAANTGGPSQRKRNSDPPNVVAADVADGKLLPTPTAGDAKASGSRNLEGSKAHPGVSLTDAIQTGDSRTPRLLPTPQAADGDGGRQEKGAMGRGGKRPSGQKATLPLGTAVSMRESISENPFAQEEVALLTLLPTPTAEDGERGRGGAGSDRLGAATFAEEGIAWGVYESAVRRWERVLGRAAPSPTDGKGRLAPRFVEWMLGYPDGWVTAVDISRTAQLRILGNSVQIACAHRVGEWMAELAIAGLL